MKIVKCESLGFRQTYSPEMKSSHHNYMTASSNAVHRNSHAVSYCLVAHRCLWLKAHFAPEWWASVMSDCHPDKLVRYMGVARAEEWKPTDITYSGKFKGDGETRGVRFGPTNIENLTVDYTVTGDVVNQGLIGIKGVGEKAALVFQGKGKYANIDEFVQAEGRCSKIVLERFIKLGAFRHIHPNAKALWMWYQYRYCSGMSKLRAEIREKLLDAELWTPAAIKAEIARQIAEYKRHFPKRNKIPQKFYNWKPKPNDSREKVMALYPDDFTMEERLGFQHIYLGYWIDSPLDAYQCTGKNTIARAKEIAKLGNEIILEGIIVNVDSGTTKKGDPYLKVTLTDGVQRCLIFVWPSELAYQDHNVLKNGCGVVMVVDYDDKRGTFSLKRNESIHKLMPRDYKAKGLFSETDEIAE